MLGKIRAYMTKAKRKKDWEPVIYDTTLREGMQTPGGIGGSLDERIYAANLIARYADYAELGMPANEVDFKTLSAIKDSFIENSREAGIAVLCRIKEHDIDRAEEVLKGYDNTVAHLFIGTSEEHRRTRFKGKWATKDYEDNIERMVAYAASKDFKRIMFSPEDSFRTFQENPKQFFRFVDAAIRGYEKERSGRRERFILNFPDTVGKSIVSEFERMLDAIIERYRDKIEISLHGHDDSGTATPQAVEGFAARKARWLQTTFAKLGERNGIAQTEAVINQIEQRGFLKNKRYGQEESLKELGPSTIAILAALGRTVPYEALVTGYRTNVSTAGIHTDIAATNALAYHINGDRYGIKPILEFGPTSGREQLLPLLGKIGFEFDKKDTKLEEFSNILKTMSNDEKRSLTETDAMYRAVRFFGGVEDCLTDMHYKIETESGKPAMIKMRYKFNGKEGEVEYSDNGAVEAVIGALNLVINPSGDKILHLARFEPRVVPRIPVEYLHWEKGQYPHTAIDLDVHSDLRVQTAIRNTSATNGQETYFGIASEECSFKTIADSLIDAVKKMATIERWYVVRESIPQK